MSIVITGNPGVGKHTIAKELSTAIKLPILDLNSMAKEYGLLEKNNGFNYVDPEKLKKILTRNLQTPKIIVGHLAPYCLSSKNVKKVIVLRRSPYKLVKVYQERGYNKKKIKENIGSEILGIIANDSLEEFKEKVSEIDVSNKDVLTCSRTIQEILQGKKYSDSVDWLTEIFKRKDLGEFFSY